MDNDKNNNNNLCITKLKYKILGPKYCFIIAIFLPSAAKHKYYPEFQLIWKI